MYQDDLMALMGGPKTLEEQRMADALRSQRTGGDLLGLSTIGQVSQLGQNMSQRATAGAKQMGTLAQAREQADIAQTRHDESMGLRNRQLKQTIAANQAAEIRRIADQEEAIRARGVLEKRQAEELVIKQKKADWEKTKYVNKNLLSELDSFVRRGIGSVENKIASGIGSAELQPGELTAAEKITKWGKQFDASPEYINALIEDNDILSGQLDRPAHLMADVLIEGGDQRAYNWGKYLLKNTGQTGYYPHSAGNAKTIPVKLQSKYSEDSEDLKAATFLIDSYRPEYGAPIVPGGGGVMGAVARNFPGITEALEGDDLITKKKWFDDYNLLFTMPKRHELFGGALTAPEIKSWNDSAISKNSTDIQIRSNLATRLHIIRKYAAKAIQEGLANGYSPSKMQAYFDLLAQTDAGDIDPSSPQGVQLLASGWKPGEDPAQYADGGGEIISETEVVPGEVDFTPEELARLAAYDKEQKRLKGAN